MNQIKQLCLDILKAETEVEVINILKQNETCGIIQIIGDFMEIKKTIIVQQEIKLMRLNQH